MQSARNELEQKGQSAKLASKRLAFLETGIKNKALINISKALIANQDIILKANELDYREAEASGMSPAMLDRLKLSPDRLQGMSKDLNTVASLADPIGEVIEERTLPNGLHLTKKRVPLGVIGAIYESRPNVTVDISALCLKAGNACILRGGKESLHSNLALVKVVQEAAFEAGIPQGAIQFIESTDRALVEYA